MKSKKSNKSIGKLAGQEVNTDQVKGGKGVILEREKSINPIPDPDCILPGPQHKMETEKHQKLG